MSTIGPKIVIGLETNVGLVSLNVGLLSLYFGHGIVICGTWGRGAGYKVSAAQGGAAGRQASGDKVSHLLYIWGGGGGGTCILMKMNMYENYGDEKTLLWGVG